jgi:hypothetical protein
MIITEMPFPNSGKQLTQECARGYNKEDWEENVANTTCLYAQSHQSIMSVLNDQSLK